MPACGTTCHERNCRCKARLDKNIGIDHQSPLARHISGRVEQHGLIGHIQLNMEPELAAWPSTLRTPIWPCSETSRLLIASPEPRAPKRRVIDPSP